MLTATAVLEFSRLLWLYELHIDLQENDCMLPGSTQGVRVVKVVVE